MPTLFNFFSGMRNKILHGNVAEKAQANYRKLSMSQFRTIIIIILSNAG